MKAIKVILSVAVICFSLLLGCNAQAEDDDSDLDQLEIMSDFLEMMNEYLNFSKKFVDCLKDEDLSIYLIAESITEIYEKKGSKSDAIPDLRKLAAKKKKNKVAYKAILFKIKDIYKDNKEYDKALGVLQEIADIN